MPTLSQIRSHASGAALVVLLAACTGATSPTTVASPTPVASPMPSTSPTPFASPGPSALAAPFALPDVGRILAVVEGSGENRPAYADVDGLHEIVTEVDTSMAHATWASADSIIFDSERAGGRHLFRMGIDGLDIVQLTSGNVEERAAVSPDGSTIVYENLVDGFQGNNLGLHLIDADGTNARALTPASDYPVIDTWPSFSPDGKWIVFTRVIDWEGGIAALFVINVDGSGLRRLTDDSLGASYARWSPDGRRILFTQRLDATSFVPGPLWVVEAAGGNACAVDRPEGSRLVIQRRLVPRRPAYCS